MICGPLYYDAYNIIDVDDGNGTHHGGKGRPELRHDGFLLAESIFDQNGKVSQLVGYFVEQYRECRQPTPCFHNVQYAGAAFKIRKRGSYGNAIGELKLELYAHNQQAMDDGCCRLEKKSVRMFLESLSVSSFGN